MTQEAVLRRLSAILAADVVGYARLMEADEAGTLATLNARRRDLIEPAVSKHQGRIVKTMGDGFLIEFGSVVEAVQCAIELQAGMEIGNLDLPDPRKMKLRIGINLGDVIVENDDLYGDGVNIAARLQTMAEPGSVLLSGTVYDHLKSKIAVGLEFLGERHVKNIADPIRVYRVLTDQKDAGKIVGKIRRGVRSRRWPGIAAVVVAMVIAAGVVARLAIREAPDEPNLALPDKASIAVLPFINMSGDPEQGYFADGMTDDLITDLSQVSSLFVISRNSAFAYKGKTVATRQVAKELGVRYVLEGSVQRAGDRVRINAQLIDSVTGGHVWADRYDGSLSDVFLLQDKVTRSITDALALRLTSEEQQIMGQEETKVPAAYDAFLRGWEHFRRATPEDYVKAIPYFEQAIKLDPDYGRAYAALALDYYWEGTTAWHRGVSDFTAEISIAIDPNLREAEKHPTSTAHQVAGLLAFGYGLFPKAIAEFNEAIALDPSDSWSYAYMARTLAFAGRPIEAMQYIRTAMRVDPHYPPIFLAFQGLAQFGLERYEEAAVSLEQATQLNANDSSGLLLLGAAYGYLGRKNEAKSAIAAYDALGRRHGRPPITATFAWGTWSYLKRADQDRLFKGLLLAGVPERMPAKPR
ncbi:MAG: adenylate/guanylate cyclase domain-containing protein [Dongiaceae bacterium]